MMTICLLSLGYVFVSKTIVRLMKLQLKVQILSSSV